MSHNHTYATYIFNQSFAMNQMFAQFMQGAMQGAMQQMAPFREYYRVYPEAKLEMSDKIILPPSALHKLASKNTTYPMMFELTHGNPEVQELTQKMHGGVLEFVAPEGIAHLPTWVRRRTRSQ